MVDIFIVMGRKAHRYLRVMHDGLAEQSDTDIILNREAGCFVHHDASIKLRQMLVQVSNVSEGGLKHFFHPV